MEIKKSALKVTIGFLILTAILSIWIVLLGEFGDFEIRVLLTTLSISMASMCAMACGAHIEKAKVQLAGGIGILSAIVSLMLTLVLIWTDEEGEGIWRTCFSSLLITFALAHVLLLHLPSLNKKHLWLRHLANISIGLMSSLILLLIWRDDSAFEAFFRLLITLAIIVALVSLLIPIFSKLDKKSEHKLEDELQNQSNVKAESQPVELKLTQIEGAIYADESGKEYRLVEL